MAGSSAARLLATIMAPTTLVPPTVVSTGSAPSRPASLSALASAKPPGRNTNPSFAAAYTPTLGPLYTSHFAMSTARGPAGAL